MEEDAAASVDDHSATVRSLQDSFRPRGSNGNSRDSLPIERRSDAAAAESDPFDQFFFRSPSLVAAEAAAGYAGEQEGAVGAAALWEDEEEEYEEATRGGLERIREEEEGHVEEEDEILMASPSGSPLATAKARGAAALHPLESEGLLMPFTIRVRTSDVSKGGFDGRVFVTLNGARSSTPEVGRLPCTHTHTHTHSLSLMCLFAQYIIFLLFAIQPVCRSLAGGAAERSVLL